MRKYRKHLYRAFAHETNCVFFSYFQDLVNHDILQQKIKTEQPDNGYAMPPHPSACGVNPHSEYTLFRLHLANV